MKHLEKRAEQARQLHQELKERREELQGELAERRQEQGETPAQTQLRRAGAVYDTLVDQLRQVSALLEGNGRQAPAPAVLQRNLDILLQTVLLRIAVGDEDFSHVERQFIREIPRVGDAVAWVNDAWRQEKREDLTWGKLFYLEEDELSELMDFVTARVRRLMPEVFTPLAEAEKLTETPCREVFLRELEEICRAFIAVDGEADPEEESAMHRAVEEYVARPLREAEWRK